MKNKDLRQLRSKIFKKVIILAVASIVLIFSLNSFVLRGHFANFVVAVFQTVFGMNYDEALEFYRATFRDYMELYYFYLL